MNRLRHIGYIDAKLKTPSYDHESHGVRMLYGDPTSEDTDTIVIFKDCNGHSGSRPVDRQPLVVELSGSLAQLSSVWKRINAYWN